MKIKKNFSNTIELFALKRVLILLLLLTIADMVFLKEKRAVFLGLVLGAAVSLIRFYLMASNIRRVLNEGNSGGSASKVLTRTAISILGAVAFLAAAIETNLWLFAGATAGILLVPFVLTINSLTEGLGITHNNFE